MSDIPLPSDPRLRSGASRSVTASAPRPVRALSTREPTGAVSWPVLLLSGPHKAGKSFVAAMASASSLIDRTFWLGFGEKDPDEYGALPGARFEIVPHEGTPEELYEAARSAAAVPPTPGRPNLHVVDSGTRLWDALRDGVTESAIARGSFDQNGNPYAGRDLWNKAHERWHKILAVTRSHGGPVIITARSEMVTGANGESVETIKGQRDLPYDVDAIIELQDDGSAFLTGARSLVLMEQGRTNLEWFREEGLDGLWRRMGLGTGEEMQPTYSMHHTSGGF